jgi:phospholipase D1/2
LSGIFQTGKNCWRIERADYVSVVVDYGNYYRDLHESIQKAEKSIFVLGWDIDSRIQLLRGEAAAKSDLPTSFFDLICWKARQNPDVQIYLNKWDYSMFFMREREPFWEHRWAKCGLPNIHYCLDDVLPFGACHHQKIVVIDDETAYWGGMDVALGRWDFRQHHVENEDRADPGQIPHPENLHSFGPYHDIQAVLSGSAATALAELVRDRWHATGHPVKPLPINEKPEKKPPKSWPDSDPPDFYDVDVAIARTLPRIGKKPQVEEIYHLFLDEIAHAEKFIYIENQFLVFKEIAQALNRRLHERPGLRVLAVSCYDAQGIMESRAMYANRISFRTILKQGGVGGRAVLAYPICREGEKQTSVRIHSKIMIVDDRLLHIGSANINNRSMGVDTECDIVLIGSDEKARRKIADVRNDLIREHTGYKAEEIDDIVNNGVSIANLIKDRPGSRQHLRPIDDTRYANQSFINLVTFFADPRRPLIPSRLTRFHKMAGKRPFKGRRVWIILAILAALATISLLWSHTPLVQYADTEKLADLFEKARNSPLALLWVVVIYVVGGLLFFPVTVLSGAVILVFGAVKGFIFSLAGAIASGVLGYSIGRWLGKDRLSRIFPKSEKVTEKIRDSGVIGVAVIRTLPIAPYSLMNLIFGVVNVSLPAFIMGTILGLAPGKLMLAIFGESVVDVFKQPTGENVFYAILGLAGWIGIGWLCNKLARNWQDNKKQAT